MNNSAPLQNGKLSTTNGPISKQDNYTLNEILTQPVAWQAALEVVQTKQTALKNLWEENPFSDILVTGCGSTYYLSLAVAPLLQQQLGRRARAVPASELLLFHETVVLSNTIPLLVTISRSGRTTETIRATHAYKALQKGPVLNIGCYEETELVAQSDLALVIREGQEQSVVQTRSFSAMLVAAQAAVASLMNGRTLQAMSKLPAIGE